MHPNLKFEIEKPETTPSGLSLSLLNFKVTISKDGNSSFEFYKKPAKKPLFVHHQSAIPTKSKLNFIRNERKRIEDRCSSHISATQHLNTFDDILHLNGYPEKSIEQTKRPQKTQRNPQPAKTEWSYLKIPYISERLNHRITNIFRKENIPLRIAHKYYTLKQAQSHTSTERKYTRDKCPISNAGLCLRRNAVYQLMCNSRDQQYIASTTRFIHNRVKEHLNNENSSVKKHIYSCQNKDYKGIEVKIIMSENDPANLSFMKHFTLESSSLRSIPRRNVVNSQTFHFSIL